jgi:NAD(P)-dependent dehydrogenase (short-subunit alcohol dehydrogenase family)
MTDISGKVALVTGAARGLGAAFARALAGAGAGVALGDIADTSETCAAIEAAGGKAIGLSLNVTDAASCTAAVEATVAAFGGLHILVNNAALFAGLRHTAFEEIESEAWDRLMRVNVRGTFECTRAAAAVMRRQGQGKVINLASGQAFKGTPGMLHYVASKGAVVAMTRGMARELGDAGINVNCISPGLTRSESTLENPSWTEPVIAANLATRALKREGTPDDLVGTLLFLASSASDFMTGQTLSVDGGSVMN